MKCAAPAVFIFSQMCCSNAKSCFPDKLFFRIQFGGGWSLLRYLLYPEIWMD